MLKDWFSSLESREQLLIATAAVLAALALIYLLGIGPLLSSADRAEQQVTDKQALLAELDQLAARLGPGAATGDNGSASGAEQSLVLLIDRTTRSAGLASYVKRNQPDGATNIRLRFENAPFDTLTQWLAELKAKYGLITLSANIDSSRDPGRVNCNLVLTRAVSTS